MKIFASDQLPNNFNRANMYILAEDIKVVSLALLAGRFELQKECLRDFVKNGVTEFGCKYASEMAKMLGDKFPLIQPRKLITCPTNPKTDSPRFWTDGGRYEHHACTDKLPSFCEEVSYEIKMLNTRNDIAVVAVPVPKDSIEAAKMLIDLRSKRRFCQGNINVACWPCNASVKNCPA